jgi:hypothetical protein
MKNKIVCPLCGVYESLGTSDNVHLTAMWVVNTLLEHYANECRMITEEDIKANVFLRQFGLESRAHNIVNARDNVAELEAKVILRLISNCYGPNWINTHAA